MTITRSAGHGFLVLILTLAVVACGGGGGGGSELPLYPTGTAGPGPGSGGGGVGSGGGGSGGGGSPGLTFRVLDSGDSSGLSVFDETVARTETEYLGMLLRLRPPTPPAPRSLVVGVPEVDLDNEIVVGIFLGNRPMSGYSVSILSVVRNGDGATVYWEERQPGANCAGAAVVTTPYVLIAMTRVDGAVDFNGRVRVVDCP